MSYMKTVVVAMLAGEAEGALRSKLALHAATKCKDLTAPNTDKAAGDTGETHACTADGLYYKDFCPADKVCKTDDGAGQCADAATDCSTCCITKDTTVADICKALGKDKKTTATTDATTKVASTATNLTADTKCTEVATGKWTTHNPASADIDAIISSCCVAEESKPACYLCR